MSAYPAHLISVYSMHNLNIDLEPGANWCLNHNSTRIDPAHLISIYSVILPLFLHKVNLLYAVYNRISGNLIGKKALDS